jgi:hypothetical protein
VPSNPLQGHKKTRAAAIQLSLCDGLKGAKTARLSDMGFLILKGFAACIQFEIDEFCERATKSA